MTGVQTCALPICRERLPADQANFAAAVCVGIAARMLARDEVGWFQRDPIEENTIIGGLGSALAEVVAEADFASAKRFRRIGLPDAFPDKYGSQARLMEHYGIGAAQTEATVRQLLER